MLLSVQQWRNTRAVYVLITFTITLSTAPSSCTFHLQKPEFYEPQIVQNKKKEKRKILHEDFCFLCEDGGELFECSVCPKVYHKECLALPEIPKVC